MRGSKTRHDSVNESLKSNDSVEISGFMIVQFGQKIMKQYDLANNLINFFSSHEKKSNLFRKTKNSSVKEQKIPVDLGLVRVTEGRVPVASRLHSYSKSATTGRSGSGPERWLERSEEKKVKEP